MKEMWKKRRGNCEEQGRGRRKSNLPFIGSLRDCPQQLELDPNKAQRWQLILGFPCGWQRAGSWDQNGTGTQIQAPWAVGNPNSILSAMTNAHPHENILALQA